jgi:hypothetical protein
LLLSRHTKRNFGVVSRIAMYLVVIELIYVFWLINPAFNHYGFSIHWTHLTAFVGVGGAWIFMFLRHLLQLPILPKHDHRIPELEAQLKGKRGHGHASHAPANH